MAFASVFIRSCLPLAALRVLCSCECALFIFAFSRFVSLYNGDSSVSDYYRCQRKILVLRCMYIYSVFVYGVARITRKQRHSRLILKIVFIFLFCDLFIGFLMLAAAVASAAAMTEPSLGHKWKFIYFSLLSLIRVLCEWASGAKSQCNIRNCLSIVKRLQ